MRVLNDIQKTMVYIVWIYCQNFGAEPGYKKIFSHSRVCFLSRWDYLQQYRFTHLGFMDQVIDDFLCIMDTSDDSLREVLDVQQQLKFISA